MKGNVDSYTVDFRTDGWVVFGTGWFVIFGEFLMKCICCW